MLTGVSRLLISYETNYLSREPYVLPGVWHLEPNLFYSSSVRLDFNVPNSLCKMYAPGPGVPKDYNRLLYFLLPYRVKCDEIVPPCYILLKGIIFLQPGFLFVLKI